MIAFPALPATVGLMTSCPLGAQANVPVLSHGAALPGDEQVHLADAAAVGLAATDAFDAQALAASQKRMAEHPR